MIQFRIGVPKGLDRIIAVLNKLSGGAINDIAVNAFTKFMIPILKAAYPPQKHVSRAQAYPGDVVTLKNGKQVAGYQSVKQYYWVMMNVHSPYVRTNQTKDSWEAVQASGGVGYINNTHAPSKYSMGADQANLNKLVGWQLAVSIIRANMAGGISAAVKAILAYIGF